MKKLIVVFMLLCALVQTAICQKEITILFAYTTQAACAVGGPKEIKSRVDGGMKLLNEALKNSNIGCTVTAVPEFVEVQYGSAKNKDEVSTLLTELGKPSGKFNKVHQFRQQKKADMVCLIFSGYTMGLANCPGEFMVTHYETFGSSYVFPHEFGHNLGATHEAGMHFSSNGQTFRTVSNNGGVSIPYYSEKNRTISYAFPKETKTITLGDATHDNAGTMRARVAQQSAFGEGLQAVASVSDALSAQLVNPTTARAPIACENPFTIKACYISQSEKSLIIDYECSDIVKIKLELKDKDGHSINFGGFNPNLSPDKVKYSHGPFNEPFQTGDKFILTVDVNKEMVCPIGKENSAKPITGGSLPTPPIPPKTVAPAPTPQAPPAGSKNTLLAGQQLKANEKLVAQNGSCYLWMQNNGDAVVYQENNEQIWDTEPDGAGKAGGYLSMQTDGNLVLYESSGKPLWASGTQAYFDAKYASADWKPVKLVLDNSGLMVLYNAANKPVWTNQESIHIAAGRQMNVSDRIFSPDNSHMMTVLPSGNVEVRRRLDNALVWQTNTSGTGVYLSMQTDGHLILYNQSRAQIWVSGTHTSRNPDWGTAGMKPVKMGLTNEGALTLYNAAGVPVWSSKTNQGQKL